MLNLVIKPGIGTVAKIGRLPDRHRARDLGSAE